MDTGTERVKLELLGISYSPLKSGAFALLLAEENGPYRIPVVIGAAEAQSIAIKLEGIVTPRPMTHELFCTFSHAFGISLEEVYIYKFQDGIFSAELTFTDGIREVKIDSRTSDAIAIAVRTGAPIYTTREILHAAGTVWNDESHSTSHSDSNIDKNDADYENMDVDELNDVLAHLIEDENYEEAARVSEIIKSRKH